MNIVSWNVNGLRSVQKKGFFDWIRKARPDVLCLQEVKASLAAVSEPEFLHPKGYQAVWCFGVKPGYSGLGVYFKEEPREIKLGLGSPHFDCEGRWMELDFGHFVLVNSYFPNSQRDHSRLNFKLEFCSVVASRLKKLKSKFPMVILCGDFNIAHKEIDLRNPKSNQKNAGFLPEERAWIDQMLSQQGWVDSFRDFETGAGHYTWWSYRPGVREKNVGWRLDYFLVNEAARRQVKKCQILAQVKGSDHCPVLLEV